MLKIKNRKFRKQITKQSNFLSAFFITLIKIGFFCFFVLSILIIIGFLIISNIKINYKKKLFQSQIEILKKQVESLEEKNQKLKTDISESQTDFFIEKKFRENLGFKKNNEGVIAFVLPEKKQEKNIEIKKNFWQKITDLFKFRK